MLVKHHRVKKVIAGVYRYRGHQITRTIDRCRIWNITNTSDDRQIGPDFRSMGDAVDWLKRHLEPSTHRSQWI